MIGTRLRDSFLYLLRRFLTLETTYFTIRQVKAAVADDLSPNEFRVLEAIRKDAPGSFIILNETRSGEISFIWKTSSDKDALQYGSRDWRGPHNPRMWLNDHKRLMASFEGLSNA